MVVFFKFLEKNGYVELVVGEEQEHPCQGWSVYPHSYPTKVCVNNNSYLLLLVSSFNINKADYLLQQLL